MSLKIGSSSPRDDANESLVGSGNRIAKTAQLGRGVMAKDWNRSKEEAVKIPKEYFEKSSEVRLKEQTDLLRQF